MEAISRIEVWMSSYRNGLVPGSVADRAALINGILDDYHGSNRIRLECICPALGCAMRSLQREFKARYGESMYKRQDSLRLARTIWCMKAEPGQKLSALAFDMGYDRLSEFSRYFRKRTGYKPHDYIEKIILGHDSDENDTPSENS